MGVKGSTRDFDTSGHQNRGLMMMMEQRRTWSLYLYSIFARVKEKAELCYKRSGHQTSPAGLHLIQQVSNWVSLIRIYAKIVKEGGPNSQRYWYFCWQYFAHKWPQQCCPEGPSCFSANSSCPEMPPYTAGTPWQKIFWIIVEKKKKLWYIVEWEHKYWRMNWGPPCRSCPKSARCWPVSRLSHST